MRGCRPARRRSASASPHPARSIRGAASSSRRRTSRRGMTSRSRASVSAALDLPAFLERDTNVAVLAEWRTGAARGARDRRLHHGLHRHRRRRHHRRAPAHRPGRHGRRDGPHHRRARRPDLRLRRRRPRRGDRLGHGAGARGQRARRTQVPRLACASWPPAARRSTQRCWPDAADDGDAASARAVAAGMDRDRRPVRVARERPQPGGHRHRRQHRRAPSPRCSKSPARRSRAARSRSRQPACGWCPRRSATTSR